MTANKIPNVVPDATERQAPATEPQTVVPETTVPQAPAPDAALTSRSWAGASSSTVSCASSSRSASKLNWETACRSSTAVTKEGPSPPLPE